MAEDSYRFELDWSTPWFFPLRRAFSRMVFGDLNQQYVQAAQRGDTLSVQRWIERGADPYCNDHEALKVAHQNGHWNTAWLLLYNGGDPRVLGGGLGKQLAEIPFPVRRAYIYGQQVALQERQGAPKLQ